MGNGLPNLEKPEHLKEALKEAGFEIVEFNDLATRSDTQTPWYLPLSGSFSLTGWYPFHSTRIQLADKFIAG